MQLRLKVLVHHVDHPVAGSPEEKQRADEDEGEEKAFAFGGDEHALLTGIHFSGEVIEDGDGN
jgi:hypothetical protein